MIKRRFNQGLAFLLAASMSFTLMFSGGGIVTQAAETGSGQSTAQSASSTDDGLPSYYNLNELGYVTSVKNQGYWGLCWGFASIAAAETSMLSEAGLTVEQFKEKYGWDFDLSERQLGWFVNTPLPTDADSMELYDNQGGEGAYILSDTSNDDTDHRLDTGGATFNASILFSAGIGPTYEQYVPYRGNNGTIVYKVTYKDGTTGATTNTDTLTDDNVESYEPYCYSTYDDWSVSEDLRQSAISQLEESYILSATSPLENDTYVYREDIVNEAKRLIVSGKAVTVSYHAITATADSHDAYAEQFYNMEKNAQYTSEYLAPNHAVTIVGYDDNYSKDNFPTQPDGDGAWIVKNSWGSDESDFPNYNEYGNHGYFYLSYYDRSITTMEAFDFDISNWNVKQSEFFLKEYDYMPGEPNTLYGSEDELYSANVFTTDKDAPGLLKHVSIITPTNDVDYTADIYILNDGFKNPTDGTLVGTVSNHYDYAGYHRVSLSEAIYIPEDTAFSVVVTMKADRFSIIGATCGYNEEGARAYGSETAVKSVVNKGESFLYKDGQWTDWSDSRKEVMEEAAPSQAEYFEIDNFPIKAFLSLVQGQIGDDLYYSISEDGNLSIVGSGDMYDYDEKSLPPWYNERQVIKSITIDEGVTHIGSYAFCDCNSATEISFAGDAPSLGENCFGNLDGTKITYYDSEDWAKLTDGLYGAKSLEWNAVDNNKTSNEGSSDDDSDDGQTAEEREEAAWEATTNQAAAQIQAAMEEALASGTLAAAMADGTAAPLAALNLKVPGTTARLPLKLLNTMSGMPVLLGLGYSDGSMAAINGSNAANCTLLDITSEAADELTASQKAKLAAAGLNLATTRSVKVRSDKADSLAFIGMFIPFAGYDGRTVELYYETATGYEKWADAGYVTNGYAWVVIPQVYVNIVVTVR